jgi:hypothetical protein
LISPPRHCLNKNRLVVAISQNFSDGQDVLLDDFLVYVCLGPQRIKDFLLRHKSTGVLDQVTQHVERLRRDRDTMVAAPKALIECVEPKRVKQLHAQSLAGYFPELGDRVYRNG